MTANDPTLVTAAETDGEFFVVEASGSAGPPSAVHVHDRTHEFVRVLEGRLRIERDGEVHELVEGDALLLPAGVPHRFEILADARWLLVGSGRYETERAALNAATSAGRRGAAVYDDVDGVRFLAD